MLFLEEALFHLRPLYYAARMLCAEKEGISCIGLYLTLSLELYEIEPERNYAMVLARHRIDLLAISARSNTGLDYYYLSIARR